MKLTTPIARMTAVSAAALVALTACGDSSEDEPTDGTGENGQPTEENQESGPFVYGFTGETVAGESEIRFEVPDELIELDEQVSENEGIGSYIDHRAVTAITARAADGEQCVIELEYGFDEGAVAEIEDNEWIDETEQGGNSLDIDLRHVIIAGAGVDRGGIISDTELDRDTEQQSPTSYLRDLDCAASPDDDSSTFRISFNQITWFEEGSDEYDLYHVEVPTFIYADVNIMSDGTLSIVEEGTLADHTEERDLYILDSSGNWIENPDTPVDEGVEENGSE